MKALVTLETIAKHNLFAKVLQSPKRLIITNVEDQFQSFHSQFISELQNMQNVTWLPNYTPFVQAPLQTSPINRKPILLLGDDHPDFIGKLEWQRNVTISDLCERFPQKIPISSRKKKTDKESLSALEITIGNDDSFEEILLVSSKIKLWDEAMQIILDCQPTPLLIPYSKATSISGMYQLTIEDFLRGLRAIHALVCSAVKDHPKLNIQEWDAERQLKWIAQTAGTPLHQLRVDEYFVRSTEEAKRIQKLGVGLVEDCRQLL